MTWQNTIDIFQSVAIAGLIVTWFLLWKIARYQLRAMRVLGNALAEHIGAAVPFPNQAAADAAAGQSSRPEQ